jgi:2-keto-4-pentenoate hydratase/2-oxohepta-3-ene-1,7-dioic acid hydratase in catechol pathway
MAMVASSALSLRHPNLVQEVFLRIVTIAGRVHVVGSDATVDVGTLTGGRFPPQPRALFDRWDEFTRWVKDNGDGERGNGCNHNNEGGYGPPSPEPRQIFAIGLNYAEHAAESGLKVSAVLSVFTKFLSALAGPVQQLHLPSGFVDWEAELVAVIGRTAEHIAPEHAWDYVAGLTIGQDYSERRMQLLGPAPQYSLAKSFAGFAPTGPLLVTPDEFNSIDDLEIECLVNGERVQHGRTSNMIFPVPEIVAGLSAVCTLFPGDLIFTGTPSGVGAARQPPRYLRPDDIVVTRIEGIGEMTQTCVAGETHTGGALTSVATA